MMLGLVCASASTAAPSISVAITCAPRAAIASALARPIPFAAAVTRAVLPASACSIVFPLSACKPAAIDGYNAAVAIACGVRRQKDGGPGNLRRVGEASCRNAVQQRL